MATCSTSAGVGDAANRSTQPQPSPLSTPPRKFTNTSISQSSSDNSFTGQETWIPIKDHDGRDKDDYESRNNGIDASRNSAVTTTGRGGMNDQYHQQQQQHRQEESQQYRHNDQLRQEQPQEERIVSAIRHDQSTTSLLTTSTSAMTGDSHQRNISNQIPPHYSHHHHHRYHQYSNKKKRIVVGQHGDYESESCMDNIVMYMFWMVLIVFTLVILFGDFIILPNDKRKWCTLAKQIYNDYYYDNNFHNVNDNNGDGNQLEDNDDVAVEEMLLVEYPNIDAIRDKCYYERTWYLLGFSPLECDFGRRMICSVLLGTAIGWERRAADRPAGIRTMSLVCLGSAFFTMGGQFAFRSSTMGWDAARVSAAIPSGVGFLGSALIWKETTGPKGPNQQNQVHGITTAASVWLSASVGIGVGGGLYVMSIWTVVLVIFVLRLGPRLAFQDDTSYDGNDDDDDDDDAEDDDDDDEKETDEDEDGHNRRDNRNNNYQ